MQHLVTCVVICTAGSNTDSLTLVIEELRIYKTSDRLVEYIQRSDYNKSRICQSDFVFPFDFDISGVDRII